MTVSLTLTFADLAQAEQAIAAIRAKGISTIPAGSHGGPVCQHDQSGAAASAIARQGAVEGPEGGPTGQDAPAADPVTVASVAGLNTNSPDLSLVQASAAEDRPPASAATAHKPAGDLAADNGDKGRGYPAGGATHSSPATSQGADGHPEPSSDALPAGPLKGAANGKSGHAVTNSPEREPGSPEVCAISIPMRVSSGTSRPAARAHLNAENQASPAGDLPIREHKPLRPHCQRPEMCGGYGRKHCGPCERAAGAQAA